MSKQQRYIVERDTKSSVPCWYVKDTRVPDGFTPIVIALCPRESYAKLIVDALNATQKGQ